MDENKEKKLKNGKKVSIDYMQGIPIEIITIYYKIAAKLHKYRILNRTASHRIGQYMAF